MILNCSSAAVSFATPKPRVMVVWALLVLSFIGTVVNGENDTVEVTRRYRSYRNSFSTLSDVWLCLLCALGWTVWLVAAYSKPKLEIYNEEGILIWGHVLHAHMDHGGTDLSGIPTYQALVDYKLEQYDPPLQVRKTFQTDTLLEVGFSNVELLVLPMEPQSSVLKREWKREYREYQESQQSRERGQHFSLALGALLVFLSVIGAVRAVSRLPAHREFLGWFSIVIAMASMWPAALLFYSVGSRFMNTAFLSPGRKGIIVAGVLPSDSTPSSPLRCTPWRDGEASSPTGSSRGSAVASTPRASNKHSVEGLLNKKRQEGAVSPARTTEEDERNAACYIVNLPIGVPKWKGRVRSIKSLASMSTLSESVQGSGAADKGKRKSTNKGDGTDSGDKGLELATLGQGLGTGTLV